MASIFLVESLGTSSAGVDEAELEESSIGTGVGVSS